MPSTRVDHQNGHQQQDAQTLQRGLERFCRALQAAAERNRHALFLFQRLDPAHCLTEGYARQQVE
jgi:hypothetical protein